MVSLTCDTPATRMTMPTRPSPEHDATEDSDGAALVAPSRKSCKDTVGNASRRLPPPYLKLIHRGSSQGSNSSSTSDLKLMLMMDPYGLMEAPHPTKLQNVSSSSSNNTIQTAGMDTDYDDDSLLLPISIMGNATTSSSSSSGSSSVQEEDEEEEEYFDPYTTNTLASAEDEHAMLMALETVAQGSNHRSKDLMCFSVEKEEPRYHSSSSSISNPRLEQAAQDASFYLQEEFLVHGNRGKDLLYGGGAIPQPQQEKKQEPSSLMIVDTATVVVSSSSNRRLEQAAQEASFYLREEFFDSTAEQFPLLFDKKDEKAARLETAAKDVTFYLREEFHDAQEEGDGDDKLLLITTSTASTSAEQQQFQDCQDDESIDHGASSSASSSRSSMTPPPPPSSPPLQDSSTPQASATDVSFYLQEAQPDEDMVVDLEQEECPNFGTPDKIASFSTRIDMDGAIRHKTVLFGNHDDDNDETVEEIHSGSESSMDETFEDEEMVAGPMDTPFISATAAAGSPKSSTLAETTTMEEASIGPVSLDKFVNPKTVSTIVFQREQSMTDHRRQMASQRIDMAGILQPTQIYGPILSRAGASKHTATAVTSATTTSSSSSAITTSSKPTKDSSFTPETLASTLKKEFDDHSSTRNTESHHHRQQHPAEEVGCGCGWWSLFR